MIWYLNTWIEACISGGQNFLCYYGMPVAKGLLIMPSYVSSNVKDWKSRKIAKRISYKENEASLASSGLLFQDKRPHIHFQKLNVRCIVWEFLFMFGLDWIGLMMSSHAKRENFLWTRNQFVCKLWYGKTNKSYHWIFSIVFCKNCNLYFTICKNIRIFVKWF